MKLDFADRWIMRVAGAIGVDPSECSRIVIDAQVGQLVRVYVEKYTSAGSIDIASPSLLLGAEVTVIP